MAGDPLYDVTLTIYTSGQVWYDTNTSNIYSVDSTTITNTSNTYKVESTARTNEEKEKKRIKWLLQQAAILSMKQQWSQDIKIIKPLPILKSEIQLRGVCFGGRGWA